MYRMHSIASLIFFVLITSFIRFASPSPPSKHGLHRRGKILYQAQGDSYAAGPGSGAVFDSGSPCQKHADTYPLWLNKLVNNGEKITLDNDQACAGATAERIIKQQSADPSAQLLTVSVGLEHIHFAEVINDCVYMFRGRKSGDCEKTLIIVMEHVKLEFPSKVRNVIDNVLGADRAPDFRLFLTGFVRFWNSETVQCDGVSWSYWQESEPHSGGELMIRERRQKMNAWITQVNDIIGSVVTQYRDKGDKRVNFVNYDMEFEGHRFCEHGVIEPQRGNEDRKDTYLFQYETSKDSLWGIDDKNTAAGPAVDWMKWLVDAHTEDAGLKVNEYYVNQAVSLDTQYNEFLPIFISKIFHPTPSGHRTIAVAIKDAMNAPSEIGRAINHPARLLDQAVQCGEDLTLTFPKFWVLEDGRLSAREILQRMRDHSCSGTCDALPGVIGHLQEFKRQYESGCEYAVKIGPDKELFHYSSGSGENCYTASDLMIDQCISTQKDRNTPLKSGGSITGPNYGENWAIGVRDMNAKGSNLGSFQTTSDHLPFSQISCGQQTPWGAPYANYHLWLSNWDDNQEGASLKHALKKEVTQALTHFRFQRRSDFMFEDGTLADTRISFHVPLLLGPGPELLLDLFFGFEKGTFVCVRGMYRDIPPFKET